MRRIFVRSAYPRNIIRIGFRISALAASERWSNINVFLHKDKVRSGGLFCYVVHGDELIVNRISQVRPTSHVISESMQSMWWYWSQHSFVGHSRACRGSQIELLIQILG